MRHSQMHCSCWRSALHTHVYSLSSLTEAESEISAVYMHKCSCCSTRNDSLKHTTGTATATAIVEPRWCGVLLKLKNTSGLGTSAFIWKSMNTFITRFSSGKALNNLFFCWHTCTHTRTQTDMTKHGFGHVSLCARMYIHANFCCQTTQLLEYTCTDNRSGTCTFTYKVQIHTQYSIATNNWTIQVV